MALDHNSLVEHALDLQDRLLKATQNLGHPAYGLSSSTTFGIDELREELFDFLEVPKKD